MAHQETKLKARATTVQSFLVDEREKAYLEPLGAEEGGYLGALRQISVLMEDLQPGNCVHLVNCCQLLTEVREDQVTFVDPYMEHLKKIKRHNTRNRAQLTSL